MTTLDEDIVLEPHQQLVILAQDSGADASKLNVENTRTLLVPGSKLNLSGWFVTPDANAIPVVMRYAVEARRVRVPGTSKSTVEVHISRERRQAMEDAGLWEDPVLRSKYLKSYAAWDLENQA